MGGCPLCWYTRTATDAQVHLNAVSASVALNKRTNETHGGFRDGNFHVSRTWQLREKRICYHYIYIYIYITIISRRSSVEKSIFKRMPFGLFQDPKSRGWRTGWATNAKWYAYGFATSARRWKTRCARSTAVLLTWPIPNPIITTRAAATEFTRIICIRRVSDATQNLFDPDNQVRFFFGFIYSGPCSSFLSPPPSSLAPCPAGRTLFSTYRGRRYRWSFVNTPGV